MIKHEPDRPKSKQWVLYTHDGSKVLGTHPSEAKALAQERVVEMAKHARAAGGPGSGFFGHSGRTGEVGGSSAEDSSSSSSSSAKVSDYVKIRMSHEKQLESDSAYRGLLIASSKDKVKAVEKITMDVAKDALSRLDAAPGDDPALRRAIFEKYPELKGTTRKASARSLSASTGLARHETIDGRPTTIVPVIALLEGVIHASNSPNREFVSSDVLAASVGDWEGRPLVYNHPQMKGKRLSATDASGNAAVFGTVRNARMKGKKLAFDAFIDDERAKAVGADGIVEKALQGTPMEVSVGVYTVLDHVGGTHGGKDYSARWARIYPDHFAVLPIGTPGACSVEMGCGLARAAAAKRELGGPGSGFFGHGGRPGEVGGSSSGGDEAGKNPFASDKNTLQDRVVALVKGKETGRSIIQSPRGRGAYHVEHNANEFGHRVTFYASSLRMKPDAYGKRKRENGVVLGTAETPEQVAQMIDEKDREWLPYNRKLARGTKVEERHERKMLSRDAVAQICPRCAEKMDEKNLSAVSLDRLARSPRFLAAVEKVEGETIEEKVERVLGGAGSGFFGHGGRPGEVGGSSSEGGSSSSSSSFSEDHALSEITRTAPMMTNSELKNRSDYLRRTSTMMNSQVETGTGALMGEKIPDAERAQMKVALEKVRAQANAIDDEIMQRRQDGKYKTKKDGSGELLPSSKMYRRGVEKSRKLSAADRVLAAVQEALRMAAEPTGPSDDELRTSIQDALYVEMEGEDVSVWVNTLYEQDGMCVYCVTPVGGGESTYFRRSYTVDADGNATLGDDAEEVKQHVDYVPVVNPDEAARAAGGPGSGFFGHGGRPGEVGGSSSDGGEKSAVTVDGKPLGKKNISELQIRIEKSANLQGVSTIKTENGVYTVSQKTRPSGVGEYHVSFKPKGKVSIDLGTKGTSYDVAHAILTDSWKRQPLPLPEGEWMTKNRKASSQESRAASEGIGDEDSLEDDDALDDENDTEEEDGMTPEEMEAAVQTKVDAAKAEAKAETQKQVEEVRAASAKENADLRAEVEKMRPIVAEHEARAAARKLELVTELKTCSAFNEVALASMSIDVLEGIKKTVDQNKVAPDFSGRGTPRAAASTGIPPAPSAFAKSN